jgi:ATP-dependent RNA helicase DeaD
MNDAAGEPLEAVMAEVPKDAARVIVASHLTPAVEALAERYARRARRSNATPVVEDMPIDLRYVAIAPLARASALRRLLDDTDPERAAVYVRSDDAAKEVADTLRALGIGDEEPSIVITRGEPVDNVALLVLYESPMSAEALQTLAGTGSAVIALATARQIPALRVLAGGGRVTPFVLSGPGARARSRDEKVRDELRAALANGVNARELIALEPLLTEFDGVEIAAAALRLLERDRERERPAEKPEKTDRILAPVAERAAPVERAERADREERPRSDRGDRDRGDRGERPPRGERPDRERGERSDRGARPDRGSRDSAPRSGGFSRGAPSRTPASRGEMSRLFVNAGKADGMTPRDLVGSIANESGISSDQIGKIELRDTHSIVEISAPVAEQVATKMNGITVRGKRLTMRVDNDRPSSRTDRGDRGDRGERGERSSSPRFERSDRGTRPERSSSDRGPRSYGPRSDRGAPPARGDRPSSGPRRDAPRRDGPPRSRRPS